jgi:hypothetical protein
MLMICFTWVGWREDIEYVFYTCSFFKGWREERREPILIPVAQWVVRAGSGPII